MFVLVLKEFLIQRLLSCFFGKPQFLKIHQPSELPGVRSLHHGGMRQETPVAVLNHLDLNNGPKAQLSGCTQTKWRILSSTNLKMETFGDLWVGKPKSETKIIRNLKDNSKSSKVWRCRIAVTSENIGKPRTRDFFSFVKNLCLWPTHFKALDMQWIRYHCFMFPYFLIEGMYFWK